MAYFVEWMGVSGKSPDQAMREMGLQRGAPVQEWDDAPLVGAEMPSGWFLVFFNDSAPVWYTDTALAGLSAGCRVMGGQAGETAMAAITKGFQDGRRTWQMEFDGDPEAPIACDGDVPPEFHPIYDEARARLAEDPEERSLFEVVNDFGQALTGFRYDQRMPEGAVLYELKSAVTGKIEALPIGVTPPRGGAPPPRRRPRPPPRLRPLRRRSSRTGRGGSSGRIVEARTTEDGSCGKQACANPGRRGVVGSPFFHSSPWISFPMRPVLAALLVLLALFAPRAASAQAPDPRLAIPAPGLARVQLDGAPSGSYLVLRRAEFALDAADENGAATGWLVVAGAVGGGLGMFSGMLTGALLDGEPDRDCIDFCFGPGLVYGFLLGEAVGIATGVHVANGRRGSLPLGMLYSAGILTGGLIFGNEVPLILVALPAAQIAGAIYAERGTARRRPR